MSQLHGPGANHVTSVTLLCSGLVPCPVTCPQLSLRGHHHHSWEVSIRLATTTPTTAPSTELPGTLACCPFHTPRLLSPLHYTNILFSPAVPLIQNEYVEYRNLAPRNHRQHRIRSLTDNFQQPRVLRASASATTRLTLCAVVVVSISHIPAILFDPPVRSEVCKFLYKESYELELPMDDNGWTLYSDLGTILLTDSCVLTGKRSFHIQKSTCANCGYPAAKTRKCTHIPPPFR